MFFNNKKKAPPLHFHVPVAVITQPPQPPPPKRSKALDRSPVKMAARMTKGKVKTRTVTDIDRELNYVTNEIARLKAAQAEMLPVEQSYTLKAYEAKLTPLINRQTALNGEKRCLHLAAKYPRLSLQPLTWRDENKRPRLIPFSVQSAHFRFTIDDPDHNSFYIRNGEVLPITPKMPQPIVACYQDVLQSIKRRGTIATLSTKWEGVLPPNVRQIVKANSDFKRDDMYLLAEPTNWELTFQKLPERPLNPDPLLVGYAEGSFWLLAQFDVTPLEHYVASEFAVREDRPCRSGYHE